MKLNLIFCTFILIKGRLGNRQFHFQQPLSIRHELEQVFEYMEDSFRDTVLKLAMEWEGKVLGHPRFPNLAVRVKEPKLCDTVKQYSGYLDTGSDKHFFFWFFESRSDPSRDPLILWLSGGPGCSSLTGLLTELGPCKAQLNKDKVTYNKFGWNQNANIVFLDQPLNTGFSYGTSVNSTVAAGEDVLGFLQLFFEEFPKYRNLDFHIFGESYGGHYVPEFAKHVLEHNKVADQQNTIRLKSIGVGNGLTDPIIQYKYYPDMACKSSYGPVLSKAECKRMERKVAKCSQLIKSCYDGTKAKCLAASLYCDEAMLSPYMRTGKNPYDIRRDCGDNPLCYDIIGDMEHYFNQKFVKNQLGIHHRKFKACNDGVNEAFYRNGDMMQPFSHAVTALLESKINVLIYAGDADYICNWIGNKAWTLQLEWSGQVGFNNSKDITWIHSETGKVAGELRSYKNFSFLRIYNAGHLVPYDQPDIALEMVTRWIIHHRLQ